MSRAKRKAKKAVREKEAVNRATHKAANKTKRRNARSDKRTGGSVGRTQKRGRQTTRRTNARETKGKGRVGSRLLNKLNKKGYGDLDESQVDTVNELMPYTEAMGTYLDERGVEYDESDPIETAAMFTQLNPEINDPLDDQTYDDAFVNDEDYYEGHEGYENFDWKSAAKGAAAAALGSIGKNALGYFNDLKNKQNKGEPLSDKEKQILDAAGKVKGAALNVAKDKISDTFKNISPFIIILLIAFFFFRK